ncbi:uncharacterized protein LOC141640869 [Silene latifolia]|uniref:uncharacterized protein LOC141640869 n=1 Tax=Silene latifolia TaxID=37657 RepID=UPI003D784FFB
MEILSLMINKAESNGLIEGIKLSRHSPAISHLLYADDSLLCLRLTSTGCETLRSILNYFSSISGQMINHQKSYIKFSPNSPADFKEHITDILQVQTKSNFGLYLGSPNRFRQKENIGFPITTKINYLIDLFWWKKSQNKRAQHWLPFEQLQLPKSDGGLGLKNARLVSQALLIKIFWPSQHHSTSLLSKIIRSKNQKDFPIPHKISKYSAASFGWKGIVKSTFLLRDGIAWKFGNGRSIDLRNDAWVLGNKPFFKSQTQAQTIIFADILLDSTHWSSKAVFKYFNTASAKSICALELPSEPTDDYIYWKFTEDGRYSAKSGYSYLLKLAQHSSASTASRSHTSSLFVLIWKLPCQSHIKLFVWKIVNQILPTADVLIRRGMNHDFVSKSKSDVFASAKSSVTRPSISSTELLHHCFKINVAFNKKILTGTFYIRYNNGIDHEVSNTFCCSRLQSTITALLKAMFLASAGSLQNVLFKVENNQLLRLLDKDSVHKAPISVSNSLSRIKFYLSCNINWYVSGFV